MPCLWQGAYCVRAVSKNTDLQREKCCIVNVNYRQKLTLKLLLLQDTKKLYLTVLITSGWEHDRRRVNNKESCENKGLHFST